MFVSEGNIDDYLMWSVCEMWEKLRQSSKYKNENLMSKKKFWMKIKIDDNDDVAGNSRRWWIIDVSHLIFAIVEGNEIFHLIGVAINFDLLGKWWNV